MHVDPNYGESELLQRLKNGEQEAFELLYTKYSKRIFWKFSRMVKLSEEVEELFQELFVRVWERRSQIDVLQPFSAYLYRIAENMVYDFYRKASRTDTIRKELLIRSEESYDHIEPAMFKKEAKDLLNEAIATMPTARRQAFVLCKIEEKSYQEVAGIMGISTNTVRNHVVEGTKMLKNYFQNHKKSHFNLILLMFLVNF